VTWLAQQFKSWNRIRCSLRIEPEEFALHKGRSVDVFRIAQESLTNIARHSAASAVRIRLQPDDRTVTLSITDDAVGMSDREMNDVNSFGLMGMRERAGGGEAHWK